MSRSIVILTLTLFTGCVLTTAPDRDPGFAEADGLDAFEGCYENCSDTSDGSAPACLSSIIWPSHFDYKNKPEAIHVRPENDRKLVVTAFSNGEVVRKTTFESGKEFYFKGGKIELKREYVASGATEPGNVFIGVGTGKTILGVDAEGQGRVRQTGTFAGTGFLIIPIGGSATDISRIKRNEYYCKGS